MASPRFPTLYQVNLRVLLRERSDAIGRPARIDDLPDSWLDAIAGLGLDWLYLLGAWETGPAAGAASRSDPDWRAEFLDLLPDLSDDDIAGSSFSLDAYRVPPGIGGDAALARLRDRLSQRSIRLMLDFVPNHTAPDHPWVAGHPEYYIRGTPELLRDEPRNYAEIPTPGGPLILAHGRDPNFPGWRDTVQLNYRHAGLREAMLGELRSIAARCDGVRCDMAMLLLPEVFGRTWGDRALPTDGTAPVDRSFWLEAVPDVRSGHPEFVFMAEVYWDLEWALQQQGFDFTYDKRLYDRLRDRDAAAVRQHLWADPMFQARSARFLENHDEPRAARVFPDDTHRAAAVAGYLIPGLRFFHEGQFEGRTRHVPTHLCRRPDEPINGDLESFYHRLLGVLRLPAVRDGSWQLLDSRPAWDGNPSNAYVLAYRWDGPDGDRLLVAVNYGPWRSQCYVALPDESLRGRSWRLRDLLGPHSYDRHGDDLSSRGLYLDLPAWGHHAFLLEPDSGEVARAR